LEFTDDAGKAGFKDGTLKSSFEETISMSTAVYWIGLVAIRLIDHCGLKV